MIVIAAIPNQEVPGYRKLEPVTMRSLPEFQSAQPDHTFIIEAGNGKIDGGGMSTSYRATPDGAGGDGHGLRRDLWS